MLVWARVLWPNLGPSNRNLYVFTCNVHTVTALKI